MKPQDFGKEVVCSLMDDTQCQATGPCGSHCVSEDVGCKETPIPGPQDCPAAFEYTGSAFHFGCDKCNPYSEETCEQGNKCFTIERWGKHRSIWIGSMFAFSGAVNGMSRGWIPVHLTTGSLPLSAQGLEPGLVWQAVVAQMKTTKMFSTALWLPTSQTASPFHSRSCLESERRRERTSFATTSQR